MTKLASPKFVPVVASVLAIGLGFGAAACGSNASAPATHSTAPGLTDQASPPSSIEVPDGAGDVVQALSETGVALHPLPDNPNLGVAVAADPTGMFSTLTLPSDASESDVGAAIANAVAGDGYVVVLEFANADDAKMSAEALISQLGADPGAAKAKSSSVYLSGNTLVMSVGGPIGHNPTNSTFEDLMEKVPAK